VNHLSRYWHTIKYLKFTQLLWRLYSRPKRFLAPYLWRGRQGSQDAKRFPGRPTLVADSLEAKRKPRVHPLTEMLFLNSTLAWENDWFPRQASQLWLFNLHYFDYAASLSAPEFESLVESWWAKVPVGHRLAWHPYPVSRRLCNWIWRFSTIGPEFSDQFRDHLLLSICEQKDFLRGHLEYDLLGNHLFCNLSALLTAAVFLNDAKTLSFASKELKRQVKEQILPDGGHFERSPMYHLMVLNDLLCAGYALKCARLPLPEWLLDACRRMLEFARWLDVSNTFPLLNDSSSEIAPRLTETRGRAEALGLAVEFGPFEREQRYFKDKISLLSLKRSKFNS